MNSRFLFFGLFFWAALNVFGQNRQLLYGFDNIPQTLLLNPGAEVDYDIYAGIPLLSNLFVQLGGTDKNMTYNNIFKDPESANEFLIGVYQYNLDKKDYFIVNQQIDVFNAGFRFKNPDYFLSFGMYQEIDGYSSYPEQLADLFFFGDDKNNDGKAEYENPTHFSELNSMADLVGVFHVGLSKKFNDRFTAGVRLKLISGSASFNSVNNSGRYYLSKPNQIENYHNFEDMLLRVNFSGLVDDEGEPLSTKGRSDFIKGLFFLDGNLGMGIDIGATYHVNKNVELTASLLDLDYVSYTNQIVSYKFHSFKMTDTGYYNPNPDRDPENNPDPDFDYVQYWKDTFDEGDYEDLEMIPIDTLSAGFNYFRSPKINASGRYIFYRDRHVNMGESVFRNAHYVTPLKDVLTTSVGMHIYTAFRPQRPVWAVTAFATHDFNRYLTVKGTYTADAFSYTNLGFGISSHFKFFNLYATADNLLGLFNYKDSNYQSVQFGMNLTFK